MAREAGARVASRCTGAFVAAAAVPLDGKRATTRWAHTGAWETGLEQRLPTHP